MKLFKFQRCILLPINFWFDHILTTSDTDTFIIVVFLSVCLALIRFSKGYLLSN